MTFSQNKLNCKPFIFLSFLAAVYISGCGVISAMSATPTAVYTPTPGPLKVEDIESNACLLIDDTQAKSILGIEVAGAVGFSDGSNACVYRTLTDGRGVLQIYVTSDKTIRNGKANLPYHSAVEKYQMVKQGELNMQTKMPSIFKVEDINNLGDQAFLTKATFITIDVLKNKFFYEFDVKADEGISYDALMQLAKMALQRAP